MPGGACFCLGAAGPCFQCPPSTGFIILACQASSACFPRLCCSLVWLWGLQRSFDSCFGTAPPAGAVSTGPYMFSRLMLSFNAGPLKAMLSRLYRFNLFRRGYCSQFWSDYAMGSDVRGMLPCRRSLFLSMLPPCYYSICVIHARGA